MLELPEVLTIASQLQKTIVGKAVNRILPPAKEHKFCWYNGEPLDYHTVLAGRKMISAEGFGIFVEIAFEDGYKLCFNDGVNVRFLPEDKVPKNYQLLAVLCDGTALVFTVAMYGGIILHRDDYDNEYYDKSRLLTCTVSVLKDMADKGGRDTEKDLFGNTGGYQTKMSKLTCKNNCPVCGGPVTKEAYMGGSVYYCPVCQPSE